MTIDSKANVCSVKFHPIHSNFIAFGSADHHVHYYDLRNLKEPFHIFRGHKKAASYVKFTSATELVSASTDCTLKLWSIPESISSQISKNVLSFVGHTNEKNFVGLSVNSTGTLIY
jgi:E3 ubiquitin-protein ligase RFWD2